jgi:hypothetical protein
MTKKEALALFRRDVLPAVQAQYGKDDKVARDTAWCDFTDGLCKDGYITRKQDETWTHPYAERPKRDG